MPIYEFKCNNCNAVFDEIVPMDTKYGHCKCGHIAKKTINSFLTVSTGLDNGHCGCRSKKKLKGDKE